MPRWRIETRGSVLMGAAIALFSAGLLRVDGVLMALGLAAAQLLGLCLVLGWMNLRSLETGIELPKAAQAGAVVRMRVAVRNPRRLLDAFGLELEIRAGGGLEANCQIPWVPVGGVADSEMRISFPNRGQSESIRYSLVSAFPLGLFRVVRNREIEHALVVLPRPLFPNELSSVGSALEAEPSRASVIRETSGEPRGLREYRSGDPGSSIVWPASLRSRARGGGLVVRELDPPGFQPRQVVLVFHSYAKEGALIRPDRFERAISLLWGTLRHFHAQGCVVELLADFEEWVPRRVVSRRQLSRAGDMLARARRSGSTEAHELTGRLQDLGGDGALVVFSDMPASSWRAQCGLRRSMVIVDVATSIRRGQQRGARA